MLEDLPGRKVCLWQIRLDGIASSTENAKRTETWDLAGVTRFLPCTSSRQHYTPLSG